MASKTLKSAYKTMKTYRPDPYKTVSFKGTYTPETYSSTYKPTEYTGTYSPETYTSNYRPTEYNDTYNPEQYQSKYMPQIEASLNNVTNFQYDPLQDASYQALAKVYGMRGNLAAKSTLADAAALNGGYGTSNAVSAAQQARNQYNQELAAFIPQLEQNAFQRAQGNLEALQDIDNTLYGRFSDDQSRQLQGKQFGLDVAGYNESNRQFGEQNAQNVFNMNEGNRQFAANYGLDVAGFNEGNRQFAADEAYKYAGLNSENEYRAYQALLDAYQANQAERQFTWNSKMDLAEKTMSDAFNYLNYLKAKSSGSSGGGGGGKKKSGGGSGGGYTGGSVTPSGGGDAYTKAEEKAKKNKKTKKGTAGGGGKLHNTQQTR